MGKAHARGESFSGRLPNLHYFNEDREALAPICSNYTEPENGVESGDMAQVPDGDDFRSMEEEEYPSNATNIAPTSSLCQ